MSQTIRQKAVLRNFSRCYDHNPNHFRFVRQCQPQMLVAEKSEKPVMLLLLVCIFLMVVTW